MKKAFRNVTAATPDEDAHYGIDFWAETETGKALILQSKSSFFGLKGVISENDVAQLKNTLPGESGDEAHDFETVGDVSPLTRLKKVEQDIERARRYAEKTGKRNDGYFVISVNSDSFQYPTGEPKQFTAIKALESQLKALAST